jgi:glycosyltransferase involved in cell wall biosynthesis
MNKENSLVSVIIPTYNRANFLPTAILSVINQTYQNWELTIVNDGSTDNNKILINEFIKKIIIKTIKANQLLEIKAWKMSRENL